MMEDMDETQHQILKRAWTEPCVITKPFPHNLSDKDSVWLIPYFSPAVEHRQSQFSWDRPRTDRQTLIESAARYQADQLQKLLKQKELELRLMAKQLLRTNRENYNLLKELDGYRRKSYDEIYQENLFLKHQLSKTSRENVVLSGKLRQADNKLLTRNRYSRTKSAR